MLLQCQGRMAEYDRALIIEKTRRGKAFRARAGMVNVLGGAPFGYRYIRRSDVSEARYQIIEDEAQIVRKMFRRYSEDHLSIRELSSLISSSPCRFSPALLQPPPPLPANRHHHNRRHHHQSGNTPRQPKNTSPARETSQPRL
jgi:hypothetical protein